VRVKDRLDIPQVMAGEGRDLRHRRLGKRQANYNRTSQIMKRDTADAGAGACL
jgi:hypothetical protein